MDQLGTSLAAGANRLRDVERLSALRSYGVLDSVPEVALDSLVRLAAQICDVPIGLITLVDDASQVFKAREGYVGPDRSSLAVGFCPLVVARGTPLVIPDTLADRQHADNAAARDGGMRFYAGVPLLTSGGYAIGTLCVLDKIARPAGLTTIQLDMLQALAAQVINQFELRRALVQQDILLAEQRAVISERKSLTRVQADIATADGDLDTILQALVGGALEVVPAAEAGVLELIVGDELEYHAVAGTLLPHRGLRVPLSGSLSGSCARSGEAILLRDALVDDRVRHDLSVVLNQRATILAPVARGEQILGVLKLQSSKVGAFVDRDLQLVRLFAGVATAGLTEVRAAEAQKAVAAGAQVQHAIFDSAISATRQSEEQFRIFAQAVPHQIWLSRPDGYLYWFNDQTYSYAKAARGSIDGTDAWSRLLHSEDRARAGEAWARCLASGDVYETQFRIRRHDGAFRWFLVRAVPVRDGTTITRWVGTNTDIDEHRRQTAQLAFLNDALEDEVARRTRERDRIWTSTNDLMGTAALDGFLKTVNPAWTAMLGWSEVELLKTPFIELIHRDDRPATVEAMRRLAAGEPVSGFVDRVHRKTGEVRTVIWDATPDGALFHVVGRDITALRETENQLRQSQKMEAVGQLTGGLAHDFNNLLTGITGSLDLISARVAKGRTQDIERYVHAAQGAATRAAALTHRLLAFARQQTLDPKPIDVNRLVLDLEDLVRRTIGPAVELKTVAAADLWLTLVDPNQLENALLNLCINARDAMPGGGRLTIETANRWLDAKAARERDLEPGPYVSLCVSDTGTGMTPDLIAKAFDPFFTTKPIGQGTGLGLSMIYGFVRQSGGQVRIVSEPGAGATVFIELPRHGGTVEPTRPSPSLSDAPKAARGETVLVVDDEPTVRMLVMDVLQDLGYAAIEAADGVSGLQVLQSDARIDLLVSDVGLPGGMNGRQMADLGRVARPHLQVLFITGFAENAVIGTGQLAPGMHVMAKPFAMEALASRVRDLLATSPVSARN